MLIPEQLTEARLWLSQLIDAEMFCDVPAEEAEDIIGKLSDVQVAAFINRFYVGGLKGFVESCEFPTPTVTIWVTDNVLVNGIQEAQASVINLEENWAEVPLKGAIGIKRYVKNHWWSNKEDAIRYAEDVKERKIATLQNQIDKLRQTSYE